MKRKVINFLKEHRLLMENKTVLVAVSGGPDSLALLHFFQSISEDWGLTIKALSVDHQLRGDQSREDLKHVEEICREWKIPFIKTSIDVQKIKEKKRLSTQVAGRKARYSFFKEQMNKLQADYLALGHHADDQIETMLMGFTRSTSTVALSGIPVKRDFANGKIIRPFLCVTKEEILSYCKIHRIQPRFDPSNLDSEYLRIFFRKSIIPLLTEKNTNLHTTVQKLSEVLQEDESYLQKKAKKVIKELVYFDPHKRNAHFAIEEFKKKPPSLQRRIYHLILNYLYDTIPSDLSYVHEDIFFSLLKRKKGNIQVDFPNKLQIKKVYHNIVFSFTYEDTEKNTYHKTIDLPGEINLPDQKCLKALLVNKRRKDHRFQFTFPMNKVSLPLMVRTRKPGDRMTWKGLGGMKKLKDIFIDEKIPQEKRDQWPIVVDQEGNILWLIGIRKAPLMIESKEGPFIKLLYKDTSSQEGHHA